MASNNYQLTKEINRPKYKSLVYQIHYSDQKLQLETQRPNLECPSQYFQQNIVIRPSRLRALVGRI